MEILDEKSLHQLSLRAQRSNPSSFLMSLWIAALRSQ
jgi:hypothetical protein